MQAGKEVGTCAVRGGCGLRWPVGPGGRAGGDDFGRGNGTTPRGTGTVGKAHCLGDF